MTRLVSSPSALERAIDGVQAERVALPVDLVASAWDPARCSPDVLGHLAWQLSIDLWDDSWPETKKRAVCANAIELHRLKGTLAGIRAHLELVDCRLERAVRPPARGFLRAASTPEQYAAWLESLPQLRVYPFVTRAIAQRRSFWRRARGGVQGASWDAADWDFSAAQPSFDVDATAIEVPAPRQTAPRPIGARHVWRNSRGAELMGTRAEMVDRGVATEIRMEQVGDATRVFLPALSRRTFHGRGFVGAGWLRASDAPERVVTVAIGDDAASFAVLPGLDPVSVRPARVAEPRIAPPARAFHGQHRARSFMQASWAPHLIYDRLALHAADRMVERRRTRSFHGRGRYGIRPFTAELRVAIPMQRPRLRRGAWHGSGFRQAGDFVPVARALEAIRASKALRDTVLVDTTTTREARFGDGLVFGSFAFGEIRKVA